MSRHKVEIVNVNTADIKVLTAEEMTTLFKKYQKGNKDVKEKLINGNLKLVLSILKKYNNRTDNMDDLFQVGCIGLIKAIDNFDLSFDVKFSTYAVPMIIGEVKRYLRDNNSLRIARSIKDLSYKIMKEKEKYVNQHGKEPSIKYLAQTLKETDYEISLALNSMKDTVSMFEPIYNDGGDVIYLSDQLKLDDGNIYDNDIKISLQESLKKLKEKERYILTSRYLIGKTQMELANEIGISQAQISRLEKNGLQKLKKMMK